MKIRHALLTGLVFIFLSTSCYLQSPARINSQTSTTPSVETSTRPANLVQATSTVIPVPGGSQYTQTVSPGVTPTDSPPTPSSPTRVPTQYHLDAIFDYYQHSLSVSEMITYVNHSADELADLILVVEPNLWRGSFSMVSLAWEDGKPIDNFELLDDQLNIPLAQPLQPGEKLGIKIDYELLIPELQPPSESVRPVPYGYSARQTNIVDWYPYIPPYRSGEGWLVHPRWYFGEHQVFDVGDYWVTITLAEPVQDLVIAASAEAQQDGDRYSYYLASGRSFALSAGTEYTVQTRTVGDVTIYSYNFPYDKYPGQQVMQDTASALKLYSQLIMPYQRTSLSVVEADFLDGMEYDGLFFLSRGFYDLYDGTPKGYLTFIAAHETAHQWWYGLVGNDQALEPWLDEALCTYMERIFYENVYSDYPPQSGASLVNWWWYYRVDFYNPTGWVDGSIYDFNQYRLYRDAVYLNGAKFLENLRDLVGDQAFFAFLKDYAIQNAHEIATANDFFEILANHTSVDLSDLISDYLQYRK